MAYDITTGSFGLRKEVIDNALKIYAQPSYVLKDLLSIETTSGTQNTYWAENPDVLTAPTGNSTVGIPDGANFPQLSTSAVKKTSWTTNFGADENISYIDVISNNVDKVRRSVFKLTQKIVYDVDSAIYTKLTTDADIQTFTIAPNSGWDNVSSTAIIDNLMYAVQLVGTYNYPTAGITVVINLRDERSINNWLLSKGAQFPQLSNEVATNGFSGKLGKVNVRVSNTIPASRALVIIPKVSATIKELVPLNSNLQEDAFRSTRVRVFTSNEIDVTDPKSVVWIKGTQWTA